MRKQENQKLTEVYNSIPNVKIVNELSWFKPYNRFKTGAKRWASGRGGFGSGVASALMPGSEELWGQSELEDETNIVWKQFRRDVLARSAAPTGQEIQGWFKTTLGIDPQKTPALQQAKKKGEPGLDFKKRYHDHNELRGIFVVALRQAQKFAVSGVSDTQSIFATDPSELIELILQLDGEQMIAVTHELIIKLGIDCPQVSSLVNATVELRHQSSMIKSFFDLPEGIQLEWFRKMQNRSQAKGQKPGELPSSAEEIKDKIEKEKLFIDSAFNYLNNLHKNKPSAGGEG